LNDFGRKEVKKDRNSRSIGDFTLDEGLRGLKIDKLRLSNFQLRRKEESIMKKRIFRSFLWISIFFAFVCISFNNSWAAEKKYPSRTIEMIISFPPGGPIDLQSRILAKYFEKEFGVPVVPVNKPGGGGSLGAGILVNSPPDGYTLSLMVESSIIIPILRKEVAFSLEDFRVISQVQEPPAVVLVVPPDSPWKTFQEFVDYVRKNPRVKCGHPPLTTTAALKMMYINKYAKLGLVGVPFKTDPEINVAIMGKHIPAAFSGVAALKGPLEAGKLRVLFSFNPVTNIPGIKLDPTIPDFESFFGKKPRFDLAAHLWVHGKTPDEIVQILKRSLEKIAKSQEFVNDMNKIGYMPHYVDGDIVMKEVLPDSVAFLKEILTEIGLMK
jgi:tripartite-type tricarboxylate transporter receptor subunit TctC